MERYNCAYDSVVNLEDLKPNPENNNRHSVEQIKRLAKIIDFQGQRSPIVVSNRSGFIVKGHCRLEAMKELGWTKAAVDYQDYETEAQEYADLTADNEIARWAELDRHAVYTKLEELDVEVDLLGIENFSLEPEEQISTEQANAGSYLDKLEDYLNNDFLKIELGYTKEEYEEVMERAYKFMEKEEIATLSDCFKALLFKYEVKDS